MKLFWNILSVLDHLPDTEIFWLAKTDFDLFQSAFIDHHMLITETYSACFYCIACHKALFIVSLS